MTSFDNLAMYEYLRKNTSFTFEGNCVVFNVNKVEKTIKRYEHPQAILTLKFPGINLDFYSEGLVEYWYEGGNSFASVDLRKSNKLYYKRSIK